MNFAAVTNFDSATLALANGRLVTAFNGLIDPARANDFATPDASPTSSIILSQGMGAGVLHVKCVVRLGTP